MADTTVRPWTRADLVRLPDDGNRYEVLDGELLVTPLPTWRHQRLATALTIELGLYCRAGGVGMVAAPGAISWAGNELQPDVLVFPGSVGELASGDWPELPTPILVVEIESESSLRRDRSVKRNVYVQKIGIPTYWLVDPGAETVRVITPGGADQLLQVGDVLQWRPRAATLPFTLSLAALFRPAH